MPHTAHSERDLSNVMNYINLTQTLVDSFHALADEVQALTDRKTILEHKLRFAHEQVSPLLHFFICQPSMPSLLHGHARRVPLYMMNKI